MESLFADSEKLIIAGGLGKIRIQNTTESTVSLPFSSPTGSPGLNATVWNPKVGIGADRELQERHLSSSLKSGKKREFVFVSPFLRFHTSQTSGNRNSDGRSVSATRIFRCQNLEEEPSFLIRGVVNPGGSGKTSLFCHLAQMQTQSQKGAGEQGNWSLSFGGRGLKKGTPENWNVIRRSWGPKHFGTSELLIVWIWFGLYSPETSNWSVRENTTQSQIVHWGAHSQEKNPNSIAKTWNIGINVHRRLVGSCDLNLPKLTAS